MLNMPWCAAENTASTSLVARERDPTDWLQLLRMHTITAYLGQILELFVQARQITKNNGIQKIHQIKDLRRC